MADEIRNIHDEEEETVQLAQTENAQPAVNDEALFEELRRKKKSKKRRVLITTISIVAVVVLALLITVITLRGRVRSKFAVGEDYTTYTAQKGSISTTVSGSGTLVNVDVEELTVPEGVEIDEVVAKKNQLVSEGDLIATVNMTSVIAAMSDVQAELDSYNSKLASAKSDSASKNVKAGVSGRVKIIYAKKDGSVIDCMAENGALMVISSDGYMALDIATDKLSEGESIKVKLSNGNKISGKVDSAVNGKATVLVTDNGPKFDEEVTVYAKDGSEIGKTKLYIHNPLSITGYAGTVSAVNVSLNAKVKASTKVLTLKDTTYSANYETILRDRNEKEEELMELLKIYKNGAVTAPISGSVISVDYDEDEKQEGETSIVTISPDKSMEVTISIDEAKILNVEVGQTASVTVSSVGDDAFTGTVTEVDTAAESDSGVTEYTATITLDKAKDMLEGMTAKVAIRIQGVDDAIIIPAAALHQTSTSAFVYTAYDEETKQYGGMKEVTFGLSNDDYVEITSGLDEGDVVYYEEEKNFFWGFGGGMGGSGSYGGMGGSYGGKQGSGSGYSGGSGFTGGGDFPGGNGTRPTRDRDRDKDRG